MKQQTDLYVDYVIFRQHEYRQTPFRMTSISICLFTNRTLYFTVNLRNGKIDRKCQKPVETICTGVPTNICGAMSDMIYSHMLWPRATKSSTITAQVSVSVVQVLVPNLPVSVPVPKVREPVQVPVLAGRC